MRIGIEMRLVTFGASGGIAMLLRGVLRSMFKRYPRHQFVCFSTIFNRGVLGHVPTNVELITLPLSSYFEDVGRVCTEKNVDVLFRGYPLEQQVDFPLQRQVVEIPDIQHEYLPEFFDDECLRTRRAAFSRVLAGAGAIGTISEFARQTLLEQSCTRCRDIFLMSPALQVEHQKQESLTAAEKTQIPEGDFFLFPANLWKHKNHERVLQAFERFHSRSQLPLQFLFMGHPEGWEKYQTKFGHLPIRHLGFVRPVLVRKLLERARALVFFSLYEGFGIPLLEAFDAGTPVLCSNTTSLPEVGRDAVLTCDPTDVEAMSTLMARIVKESDLRCELVCRGKQRLKAYTWEASADNLMAACERVSRRAEQSAQPNKSRVDAIERHHSWDKASKSTNQNSLLDKAKSFGRRLGGPLKRFVTLEKHVSKYQALKHARRLLASSELNEVDGIWSDNWVGATCRVSLNDNPIGEHIYLAGIPIVSMALTVAVNNEPIGVFYLRGRHLEEVRFRVEPGLNRDVVLLFSEHEVDSVGRKLSFMLHGSNLFSEHDLRDVVA